MPSILGLAQTTMLLPTPRQTTGPFYPLDWSGDADADLAVAVAAPAPAQVVPQAAGQEYDRLLSPMVDDVHGRNRPAPVTPGSVISGAEAAARQAADEAERQLEDFDRRQRQRMEETMRRLAEQLRPSGQGGVGGQCSPGPRCQAAGQRSQSFLAGMERRLSAQQARMSANPRLAGGARGAADVAYCTQMVGAEISRVCADEQRAMGREDCARQAYAQRDELLRAAQGSRSAGEAVSVGQWQQTCGWR
jgi:hypothetical protein